MNAAASDALIVLIGLSVCASPITTLLEPMQVRNQVLLSSETTRSSLTWQSGTSIVRRRYGNLVRSMASRTLFPKDVMYALLLSRLKKM